MRVKVLLYSFLREKLGWKEKILELKGEKATINDVLRNLPDLKEVIMHNGIDNFMILVNGINIRLLKMLNTELSDGSEIAIFPPGGGG